jgi:hypothetical protein
MQLAVGSVVPYVLKAGSKLGRIAQGLFDPSRLLRSQRIGQVVAQGRIVDRIQTDGVVSSAAALWSGMTGIMLCFALVVSSAPHRSPSAQFVK